MGGWITIIVTQHLATLLFTLNVLAFLIHTAQHMLESPYRLVRDNLSSRKKFFDDLRAPDSLYVLRFMGCPVSLHAGRP